MSGVPADYLLWLHENGKCSESVARYIEEHKPAIEQRRDTEAADLKQKTADRMPFGSYKGEVIAKVPAEYLLAMYARRRAYMADITFGTNNEFGFDYLRDNMAVSPKDLVQRKHNYAIVDEVDSVLIDDARC